MRCARVPLVFLITFAVCCVLRAQAGTAPMALQERICKEVRHELFALPFLGVFDNLTYQVSGTTVVLEGQVTRMVLKTEAESAVKSIKCVSRVENHIEVLPVSPSDNDLRLKLFRAIYGYDPLQKYSFGVTKPIRILVKQGNVTLEGIVDYSAERDMAGIRAGGVTNVSSVKNNLRVAK